MKRCPTNKQTPDNVWIIDWLWAQLYQQQNTIWQQAYRSRKNVLLIVHNTFLWEILFLIFFTVSFYHVWLILFNNSISKGALCIMYTYTSLDRNMWWLILLSQYFVNVRCWLVPGKHRTLKLYLFNLCSAGIDFIRQNLTSVDVRFWRIKSIPATLYVRRIKSIPAL